MLGYGEDSNLATLDLIVTTDTDPSGPDGDSKLGAPTLGDVDTLHGNRGNDLILGGNAGDFIYGGGDGTDDPDTRLDNGTDFDLIIGDNGQIHLGVNALGTNIPIRVETIVGNVGGGDVITGDENDDIILGGTGDDRIDGNMHDDLILGDNGVLVRRVDGPITDPRFRVLTGSVIYDGDGTALISRGDDATLDESTWQENPNPHPDWDEWVVTIGDGMGAGDVHGNDYIAGGPNDDVIFGQLGNDTIQGDGSIDGLLANGEPVAATGNPDGSLTIAASF